MKLAKTESSIKIYLFSTDQPGIERLLDQGKHLLTTEERLRAARTSHDEVRKLYVASRILLRKKLAEYLKTDPGSLIFGIHSLGKPFLSSHPQLEFNLSHSKKQIAIAVSDQFPLGVDIEYVKRKNRFIKIANRYFSDPECEQLEAAINKRDMFFNFWTLKEAYIKALGMGLRKGLKTFGFDLSSGINVWDQSLETEQTSFYSYRLTDDYHLSLCPLKKNIPPPSLCKLNLDFGESEAIPVHTLHQAD